MSEGKMELRELSDGRVLRFDPATGRTWQLTSWGRWELIDEPEADDGDSDDDGDDDADGDSDSMIRSLCLLDGSTSPFRDFARYQRFHEVGARARVAVRTMAPDGVERELLDHEFAPLAVAFDAMWFGYLRDAGLMERNDTIGMWVKKPGAPVSYVVRDPARLDNLPMPRMYYDRNGASMHLLDQPERVFTLEATDQEVGAIGRETPSQWPVGTWHRVPGPDGIRAPLKSDEEYEIAEGGPRWARADTSGTERFIGESTPSADTDGDDDEKKPAAPDYRSDAAWE